MIPSRIKQLIDRYQACDPAARSRAEIFFLYPGPRAILFHRLAHFLWQADLFFIARTVSEIGRLLTGIEIHPGAEIGSGLVIDHGMGVVIGETAVIGNGCVLFQGVTLGGVTSARAKRHPTLGNGVTIGAGAKVLGDINIGDGARVGANSVVLTDIPSGATAVGIPARTKQPDLEENTQERKEGV